MEKKNYIVAVDLGTSNVIVAVASRNEEGLLDIIRIVETPSAGVNAGCIENIALVRDSMQKAFRKIEEELDIKIAEVYAGISGEGVRCARHTDHVFTRDSQNGVSQADMDSLFDRMRNVQAPDDEVIMERSPQNYMVDDHSDVGEPVGRFGKKLASTFNFILADKVSLQRLDMAIKQLGITPLEVIPNALAAAESTLSNDEKEEGVALVDIGGGVTNVVVYHRQVLRYMASIPMGANAINRDIRSQSIPEKYVENLKIKYGSAVAELAMEKTIKLSGRGSKDSQMILLHNLGSVIEARATDIVDFVMQELRDSGFDKKLAFGIVLTGGSANLQNIDELFRRHTQMEVRVASPDMNLSEESVEKVSSPTYATVVGLLLRGSKLGGCIITGTVKNLEQATRPDTTASVAQPTATPTQSAPSTPYGASPSVNRLYEQPRREEQSPRTIPVVGAPQQPLANEAPASQPAPQPTPQPIEQEEESPKGGKGKKRDLGSFLKSAISRIGDGFNAPDDEDI